MQDNNMSDNAQHQPLVSVLCFAYNAEKFLKECIDSILNQTYKNIELIFVDNGSGDSTHDIIKSYNDSRIKIHRILTNRGPNIGYLTCLEHATGEYTAWISADDVWLPTKLEQQISFLLSNDGKGYVGCFTQWENIDEFGNKYEYKGVNAHTFGDTQPLNRTKEEFIRIIYDCREFPFAQPSFVCKTDVLREVDTSDTRVLLQARDYWLWLKILLKYDLAIIEEPLLYYRRHGGNHSQATPNYIIGSVSEWKQLIKVFFTINDWQMLTKVFPEFRTDWDVVIPELKDFYIAMLMCENGSFVWQQVGCEKLYELLQNRETADLIEKKHNFGPWEFTKFQERHDPYHLREFVFGYAKAKFTGDDKFTFDNKPIEDKLELVAETKYFYNSGSVCVLGYQDTSVKFKNVNLNLSKDNIVYFNIRNINFTTLDGSQYTVKFSDILNSSNYKFTTHNGVVVQLKMDENVMLIGGYTLYVSSGLFRGIDIKFSEEINQFSIKFSADLLANSEDVPVRISRILYKGWRMWIKAAIKYMLHKCANFMLKKTGGKSEREYQKQYKHKW